MQVIVVQVFKSNKMGNGNMLPVTFFVTFHGLPQGEYRHLRGRACRLKGIQTSLTRRGRSPAEMMPFARVPMSDGAQWQPFEAKGFSQTP